MKILTERAWAAGFFDGEGNVVRRKDNGIIVQIDQVDRDSLDRFREAVGAGHVLGPYGPYQANRQAYYKFSACGVVNVQTIYDALGPYLGLVKSMQFETALGSNLCVF